MRGNLPGRELTPELFTRLLSVAESNDDKTLLLFLYSTGPRRIEVKNFTLDDINYETNYITLHSEIMGTYQNRQIPVSSELIHLLCRYAASRRPLKNTERTFFLNRLGKPLCAINLQDRIKKLGKKIGVPTLTVHSFRRAYRIRVLGE